MEIRGSKVLSQDFVIYRAQGEGGASCVAVRYGCSSNIHRGVNYLLKSILVENILYGLVNKE